MEGYYFGPYCCLGTDSRISKDFNLVVQKAKGEGFSYVVKYTLLRIVSRQDYHRLEYSQSQLCPGCGRIQKFGGNVETASGLQTKPRFGIFCRGPNTGRDRNHSVERI